MTQEVSLIHKTEDVEIIAGLYSRNTISGGEAACGAGFGLVSINPYIVTCCKCKDLFEIHKVREKPVDKAPVQGVLF